MKIAIVSANKEDNLGDKLIYEALSSYLTEQGHDISPINFRIQYYDQILATNSTSDAKAFLKQWAIIYITLQVLYFALRLPNYLYHCKKFYKGCDIVMIGGGQLIMDSPKSILGPLNMLFHVCVAKYIVGKYVFLGVGIASEFHYSLSQYIFKYCLKGANAIICRDVFSFNRALSYVPDTVKVKCGADLALLFKTKASIIAHQHNDCHLNIGISTLAYYDIRYFPVHSEAVFQEYKLRISLLIKEFYAKNYQSVLIPTATIDCIVANEINRDLTLRSESIDELFNNIGLCDRFVATRMHSFIIATILGIPAVCMNWDDKVRGYIYGIAGFNAESYLFDFEDLNHPDIITGKLNSQSSNNIVGLINTKRRTLKSLIDDILC